MHTTKYKISIILNVVLILLMAMYAIHKINVIIDKPSNIGAKSPTEEALFKFNNEPLQVLNDSLMIKGADSTVTILTLAMVQTL